MPTSRLGSTRRERCIGSTHDRKTNILQELEVGHANMTGAEAVLEQLSINHMKSLKTGGTQIDGMKEDMEDLNRDL